MAGVEKIRRFHRATLTQVAAHEPRHRARTPRQNNHMVTDDTTTADSDDREQILRTVTSKALIFGESSAKKMPTETFDDPVMHTYFLFYVFGALESLGEDLRLGAASLSEAEKQAAMAEALAAFGTATKEQILGTIKLLVRSSDAAAIKIRNAGKDAAIDWDWGDNDEASSVFADLMKDPDNFPRDVEQSLNPALSDPSPTLQ